MANISAIKLPDGVTYDLVDRVSKEVFVAEYGVTTYSDLVDAIDVNKTIVVIEGSAEYEIITYCWYNATEVFLTFMSGGYNVDIIVTSSNTWSTQSKLYQEKLVSGTNIKTINGNSILGSGDLTVTGGTQVKLVRW